MSLSPSAVKLPLRHLSIRVPWHDAGWDGTICRHPLGNSSCLVLDNIGKHRDDDWEVANAGKPWNTLQDKLPPCLGERAGFMAPFPVTRQVTHPYASWSPAHARFRSTALTMPPYSAASVPFFRMRRENAPALAEQFRLAYDEELEARANTLIGSSTQWLQDYRSQGAILDNFYSAVQPGVSLCFFYAKQVPLTDVSGHVLVGVGRVTGVGPPVEYAYQDGKPGALRSLLWERSVAHSIRPNMHDGFLLPYQQLLELAKSQPDLDLAPLVAFAPEDHWTEFSYAAEHVSHDAAIAALLTCAEKLRAIADLLPGDWEKPLAWIDARLNEVWQLRGPYPGLGSALCAFGVPHGNLVAYEIGASLQPNEDPWPAVDSAFADPSLLSPHARQHLGPQRCAVWLSLPEERRALLKLLARFAVTTEQATRFYDPDERKKARITVTDADLLKNPYLLYERDRFSRDAIAMTTIDRGVFPEGVVRAAHPLPTPSLVAEPIDARRVRAGAVAVLEAAALAGDTLVSGTRLLEAIRELPLQPLCQVNIDVLPSVESHFAGVISRAEMADGTAAYQLQRLVDTGAVIRAAILNRLAGARHQVAADWEKLLAAQLEKSDVPHQQDEDEQRARAEKVAALAELAASRVSVLIGPAGTGKTTMLAALINQPQIAAGNVTLLTPTGKARVQLSHRAGLPAQTIAQFLIKRHRYDWRTAAYLLEGDNPTPISKTLIIDEASMLTEEQLAATLKAVTGVERLILVGDPRQLPPIGSGRPFADIIATLKPKDIETKVPRVGPAYTELTVVRRQDGQRREDVLLASWFGSGELEPGADEVWSLMSQATECKYLRFVPWTTPQDLHDALLETLVQELPLGSQDDSVAFEVSLGGTVSNGYVYFNCGSAQGPGSAAKVEQWQILTPVRGDSFGVTELNRLLQRRFRAKTRASAVLPEYHRRIPRPLGPEEIVYGDKVMQTVNDANRHAFPTANALDYVANGEIGIVVGQFRSRGGSAPYFCNIEFASQPGYRYSYTASDFADSGEIPLELAYALTIHKAQGSEFGTTFVVLPKHARMMSRELLYTALTRQQRRVVVLHQGDLHELQAYSSPQYSETARRLTNLFAPPAPVEADGHFLEQHLIHRTTDHQLVRSKSEVIIANLLNEHGVQYRYEQPLIANGQTRYPDFTIDDAETGKKVYWEHLGLLHLPEYMERWQRKLDWYLAQDILPYEKVPKGGAGGLLVTSRDDLNGAIDSPVIEAIIKKVFAP